MNLALGLSWGVIEGEPPKEFQGHDVLSFFHRHRRRCFVASILWRGDHRDRGRCWQIDNDDGGGVWRRRRWRRGKKRSEEEEELQQKEEEEEEEENEKDCLPGLVQNHRVFLNIDCL